MSQDKFINRIKELEILQKEYEKKMPSFSILYGKRRIGKTQLINKFIEKNLGIYFFCSNEGDKINLNELKRVFNEFFNDDLYLNLDVVDSWYRFFESVIKISSFKEYTKKKKLILVLDEFPYLIEKNSAIPSVFQKIWDLILKNENIMLIILGSSQSVIENKVLAYKSPLYGRRTQSFMVDEMDFSHFNEFIPEFSFEDKLNVYFTVGGVTMYLNLFDSKINFYKNIENNFLYKISYLLNEADFLLNEEFRETKNYKIILKAISNGKNTSNEICGETGLDKGLISRYLEILKELYIISEEKALLSKENSRKNRYYIIDNYFDFWFKYILPNKNKIELEDVDNLLKEIKGDFLRFSGKKFEKFILKYFYRINNDFLKYEKIGTQWGSYTQKRVLDGKLVTKTYEIDIVGVNEEKKEILFGECKWQDNVDANKILKELKEKSKLVNWNNENRKEKYVIFAKSFKDKNIKNCTCYDLSDLEKIFK